MTAFLSVRRKQIMNDKFKRSILQLFFPNRCPVCGKIIFACDSFCGECESKLKPFSKAHCIKGAAGFTALYEYNDDISPAIFLMKNGIGGNAPYAFGKALADRLISVGYAGDIDLIVPVPMFKRDEKKRGFNQSELICKETGKFLSIPVNTKCLKKIHSTSSQKSLGRMERLTNLTGAFTVTDAKAVKGKRILVIDDVCTTGSTLSEITHELINVGAEKVYCAACCKTPEKNE